MENEHVATDTITRPIIGIEHRSAQEVFEIMCDRFTAALAAAPKAEPVAWQPKYKQEVIDHHRSIGSGLWEYAMTVFPTKEEAEGYGLGDHDARPLYAAPLKLDPAELIHETLSPDEAWELLCNSDDRTSPEEYPDHALITKEELESYMLRAASPPAPADEKLREALEKIATVAAQARRHRGNIGKEAMFLEVIETDARAALKGDA